MHVCNVVFCLFAICLYRRVKGKQILCTAGLLCSLFLASSVCSSKMSLSLLGSLVSSFVNVKHADNNSKCNNEKRFSSTVFSLLRKFLHVFTLNCTSFSTSALCPARHSAVDSSQTYIQMCRSLNLRSDDSPYFSSDPCRQSSASLSSHVLLKHMFY